MTEVIIMADLGERRDRLERAIRRDPSFHLAGTVGTFPFLRSLIDQTGVEVCIVDLSSKTESETVHNWLLELLDLVSLVILSPDPDPWIFTNILRAERGALLQTDASTEQIVRAIHSTSVGLISIDRSMVPEPEAADGVVEELTPREIDVLRLLAEGFANREIATRLDISEHTIKFHIRSILAKLGASTRTEAVTRGFRAGLIEL
jgi:NarL family two-component system response regulator YdfI